MKVEQTEEDLNKQLDKQIELLQVLSSVYDKGDQVVAMSMASAIRVVMHDTDKSHSLLAQLGLEGTPFFDSCLVKQVPDDYEVKKRVATYSGLFGVALAKDKTFFAPYLDETPGGNPQTSSYADYWNRVVIEDNNRTFTRRDIVLLVANKDGGAHVDPYLDAHYVDLVRNNSFGLKGTFNGIEHEPPEGAVSAAIRQIAHEVIRTLYPDYPRQKMSYGDSNLIAIMGMELSFGIPKKKTTSHMKGRDRNQECTCGSGLKYKKCCGL